MSKPVVVIYTDGSCVKGTNGGWAAALFHNHNDLQLHGNAANTTNNRMELTAVIEALKILTTSCDVHLHSDSKYVINGVSSWIYNWQRNGWKTKEGEVSNKDLWEELLPLVKYHKIHPHWVKGHNGDPGNELVDKLARYRALQLDQKS